MFEKFESKSRLQFYFVKLFENNEKEAGDGPFLKVSIFLKWLIFRLLDGGGIPPCSVWQNNTPSQVSVKSMPAEKSKYKVRQGVNSLPI